MKKKCFVICTVRGASDEYKKKLESYVEDLENKGYNVHLPHRDTKQDASGYDICTQNGNAIIDADEIHIFYNKDSQGTHFDMGMTFMLHLLFNRFGFGESDVKVVIVNNEKYGEGKSYARMLDEWVDELKNIEQDEKI
jgi:hypothetical protein